MYLANLDLIPQKNNLFNNYDNCSNFNVVLEQLVVFPKEVCFLQVFMKTNSYILTHIVSNRKFKPQICKED